MCDRHKRMVACTVPKSSEAPSSSRWRVPTWLAVLVLALLPLTGCGAQPAAEQTPASSSATPAAPHFSLDKTYTFNRLIGHSRVTSGTNDDVDVTLNSLTLSTSAGTSTLRVEFNDRDSTFGAHFLFQALTNVYMVDNQGMRYQAIAAKPDQLIIQPHQSGAVTFTYPLVHADASSLQVFVNTDRGALDTQCTVLSATGTATTCP